jgi:aspartate kinase
MVAVKEAMHVERSFHQRLLLYPPHLLLQLLHDDVTPRAASSTRDGIPRFAPTTRDGRRPGFRGLAQRREIACRHRALKETTAMEHTVIKLGGSVLKGPRDAGAVLDILVGYDGPVVVVVSALKGVTDRLAAAEAAPERRLRLVPELREEYRAFAEAFGAPLPSLQAAYAQIDRLLEGLGRLLDPAESPRATDARAKVLASGERLSAVCVALAFVALGRPAPVIEPGRLGLVARPSAGRGEDAIADIAASAPRIRRALESIDAAVVPGFYGVGTDGSHLLFGRGGSDYSAAVIAACLCARGCDFIKDVAGFFTADPSLVPGAMPVLDLSYAEAEALSRGGSTILHYGCVEPLREAGVALRILGGPSQGGQTRVGFPRPGELPGPRAVALARGPSGSAAITVAGGKAASRSAALVLQALESRGLQARAFSPGADSSSFRFLVDSSRGDEALKIAHEALFGPQPPTRGQGPLRLAGSLL